MKTATRVAMSALALVTVFFDFSTPVFAADGVLTASLVSGGIFGGIAATFFIRGRKGKYAAMGRG